MALYGSRSQDPPISTTPPSPKIIQIMAWRDKCLALTNEGKIYSLTWVDSTMNTPERLAIDGILFEKLPPR